MSAIRMNIDMDKRCIECGKAGTLNESPICMSCMANALVGKPMKTAWGRAYAQRVKDNQTKARGES